MATNIPQDDFKKTALRLPQDLHAAIHKAAADAGRSYNAEIISRLQASFGQPAPASDAADVASLWMKIRGLERKGASLQMDIGRCYAEAERLRYEIGVATSNMDSATARKHREALQRFETMLHAYQMEHATIQQLLNDLYDTVSISAPGAARHGLSARLEETRSQVERELAEPAQKAAEALAAEPSPLEPRPSKPRKPITREALQADAAQAPLEPRPVTSTVRKIITREPEAPKAVGSTVSARRINLRKK